MGCYHSKAYGVSTKRQEANGAVPERLERLPSPTKRGSAEAILGGQQKPHGPQGIPDKAGKPEAMDAAEAVAGEVKAARKRCRAYPGWNSDLVEETARSTTIAEFNQDDLAEFRWESEQARQRDYDAQPTCSSEQEDHSQGYKAQKARHGLEELTASVKAPPKAPSEAEYTLTFTVVGALHIAVRNWSEEKRRHASGKDGYFLRLSIFDSKGRLRYKPLHSNTVWSPSGNPVFSLQVELASVRDSDTLKFSLLTSYFADTSRVNVGRAFLRAAELRSKTVWPEVWLFTHGGGAVFNRKLTLPTTISIYDVSFVDDEVGGGNPQVVRTTSLKRLDIQEKDTEEDAEEDYGNDEGDVDDYHDGDEDNVDVYDDDGDHNDGEHGSALFQKTGSQSSLAEILARVTQQPNSTNDDILLGATASSGEDNEPMHSNVSASVRSYKASSGTPGIFSSLLKSLKRNKSEQDLHLCSTVEKTEHNDDSSVEGSEERGSPASQDTIKRNEGTEQKQWNSSTKATGSKSVLILTRGTRGDVQPFIALARGLAEILGWDVFICTELRYKDMIEKFGNVSRGSLQYLPSGGDTERRIDSPLCKWAISSKSKLLHATMLAYSEREFFDSEPAFYYWANRLRPDVLCYTFTTANIAMIISEALQIPCLGFFLQPTVLPSSEYPPIIPLHLQEGQEPNYLSTNGIESHKAFRYMKRWLENSLFFQAHLDDFRLRRGLPKARTHVNDVDRIMQDKMPVVVPIREQAFGGRPADWPENICVSNFIFLRGGATAELSEGIDLFISRAKARGEPVMCICFSSMPLSRIRVLESALVILDQACAPFRPAVIALIGNRPSNEPTSAALEQRAARYIEQGRLFIDRGAPFSKLFPKMDFIVSHGGLGSTAEALAAGKPILITGVLLLDQRFWGKRVYELGAGPKPLHISEFSSHILDILPLALDPQGLMAKRAAQVALELFPEGFENLDDGVRENVAVFQRCVDAAFPAHIGKSYPASTQPLSLTQQPKLSRFKNKRILS